MQSTQANVVLGSRPTADHWWRQEGHAVLNALARTKVISEAPSKSQGMGGNGGRIERVLISKKWGELYLPNPDSGVLALHFLLSVLIVRIGFKGAAPICYKCVCNITPFIFRSCPFLHVRVSLHASNPFFWMLPVSRL